MRRSLTVAVAVLMALGLEACSDSGHSTEWESGYTYGHGAAREDYTGSLTGAAADDACNHSLGAVPDGFGDPSNADWVAGFMTGCEAELKNNSGAASAAASVPTSTPSPEITWPQITTSNICQLLPGSHTHVDPTNSLACDVTWSKWQVTVAYDGLDSWNAYGNYRTRPLPGLQGAVYATGIHGTGAQGNTAAAYQLSGTGTGPSAIVVYGSGSTGMSGIQGSPNPPMRQYPKMLRIILANMRELG